MKIFKAALLALIVLAFTACPPPDDCTHDFTVFVSTTATCTAAGQDTYKCSRCDETELRDRAALGHSFTDGVCDECGEIDLFYNMPTQVAMGAETIPVEVAEGITSTQANALLALFTSRYNLYGNKAIFNGKIVKIRIVNTSTIWIEDAGKYILQINVNANNGEITSLLSAVETEIDNGLAPATVMLGSAVPVERGAGVSGAQTKTAADLVKSTYDSFSNKSVLGDKIIKLNITTGTTGWTASGEDYILNINYNANAGQITTQLTAIVEDIQTIKVYGIPVTGEVTQTRADTIKAAIDYVEVLSAPHAEYVKDNITEFRIVVSGIVIEKENGKWIAKIGIDTADHPSGAMAIGDELANWADEQPDLVAFLQMQKDIRLAMNTDMSRQTVAQAKAPINTKAFAAGIARREKQLAFLV